MGQAHSLDRFSSERDKHPVYVLAHFHDNKSATRERAKISKRYDPVYDNQELSNS